MFRTDKQRKAMFAKLKNSGLKQDIATYMGLPEGKMLMIRPRTKEELIEAMGDFLAKRNWGEKNEQPVLKDVKIVNPKDLEVPRQKERYEALTFIPERNVIGTEKDNVLFVDDKEHLHSAKINKKEHWGIEAITPTSLKPAPVEEQKEWQNKLQGIKIKQKQTEEDKKRLN